MEQFTATNKKMSLENGWEINIGDTVTILNTHTKPYDGLNIILGYDVKNENNGQQFYLSRIDQEAVNYTWYI